MSAFGVKRTCRLALQMFAFDPKRTFIFVSNMPALRPIADHGSASNIEHCVAIAARGPNAPCAHMDAQTRRWIIALLIGIALFVAGMTSHYML